MQTALPIQPKNPPLLNAPSIVIWFCGLLIGIHIIRLALPRDLDNMVLFYGTFMPELYQALFAGGLKQNFSQIPLGIYAALLFSPLTYSFLHASLAHVGLNALWLLVFGSPVARRFGVVRFLALCAACSTGGALAHFMFSVSIPIFGASAVVSGLTGAALRFVFERDGALFNRNANDASYLNPAPHVKDNIRNPQVLFFIGIWFALNFLSGMGAMTIAGEGGAVAWEAHIGGFLAGYLLFSWFDPVKSKGL